MLQDSAQAEALCEQLFCGTEKMGRATTSEARLKIHAVVQPTCLIFYAPGIDVFAYVCVYTLMRARRKVGHDCQVTRVHASAEDVCSHTQGNALDTEAYFDVLMPDALTNYEYKTADEAKELSMQVLEKLPLAQRVQRCVISEHIGAQITRILLPLFTLQAVGAPGARGVRMAAVALPQLRDRQPGGGR
eukprot:SAG11_NODE_5464_length_1552_cov_1.153476_1_plen_189_part_00